MKQFSQADEVVKAVFQSSYVDNCLQSLSNPFQAKQLINKLRATLSTGGFDIRQWACNNQLVLETLPTEALANSCVHILKQDLENSVEGTLGLT